MKTRIFILKTMWYLTVIAGVIMILISPDEHSVRWMEEMLQSTLIGFVLLLAARVLRKHISEVIDKAIFIQDKDSEIREDGESCNSLSFTSQERDD